MAQFRASVVLALEQTTANTRAYVLGFEVIGYGTRVQSTGLAFLSICCFLLACAAVLAALMTSAIKCRFADAHAFRRLNVSLMADCTDGSAAAATSNSGLQETWTTFPNVTDLLARMAAGEFLFAGSLTWWDLVGAGRPGLIGQVR